ncbi:DUF2975 domain-containing protein [Halobacillus locisalis]|uniref:DUF2975 domain-containing protein n=1 Tax=Halobacillus locisalis TaxID=220753 RepID=A0A838CXP4_9BACI|nr:DUF2975 domain-containing protein [Halobacillus locisalis]MBA2176740.1 DUF2975 domain-containing protein [Halobacillus locisalis]
MRKTTILSLKISLVLIGLVIMILSIFVLPSLADSVVQVGPEFSYLKAPVFLGIYITNIPFFYALFQAFQLLRYIEQKQAFSSVTVLALKKIKWCAYAILSLYIVGSTFLMSHSAFHPSLWVIGGAIMFASVVIAVFVQLLQGLLNNAMEIKEENELTV